MKNSGWLVLGLLGVVLVLTLVVVILVSELARLVRELEYINQQETNAELTSSTRWPLIRRLAAAVNQNVRQSRELREAHVVQQEQIHHLLTNLTHDIKTPLTVASGYVQLIQKAHPQSEKLVRVAHNLTAVDYYLSYLMNFNLTQEQSTTLQLAQVDLTALVRTQLFDVFDELETRHLTLTPVLDEQIELITDAAMVRRVLQNLIGNWLKYASGGVRVSLRQRDDVHVELILANQTAKPVTNIQHLVERFYTSDTARGDSTGLGLSIVANLMTRLDGTLTLSVVDGWFTATLIFRRTD